MRDTATLSRLISRRTLSGDPMTDPQSHLEMSPFLRAKQQKKLDAEATKLVGQLPDVRQSPFQLTSSAKRGPRYATALEALMSAAPHAEPVESDEEFAARAANSPDWIATVEAAIDDLPERDRAVFLMHRAGLGDTQIGRQLNLTVDAVRWSLKRAQKALASVVPDDVKERLGIPVEKKPAPLTKRQKALKLSVAVFPDSPTVAAEAYMGGLPLEEIADVAAGGADYWEQFKAECWRIDQCESQS